MSFNSFHDRLDRERVGIAGHSLGASGVSSVQGYAVGGGGGALGGGRYWCCSRSDCGGAKDTTPRGARRAA